MKNKIFVTCPRGLEEVLSKELTSILGKNTTADHGGVHVDGNISDIYQINLSSRIAMHVLQQVINIKSTNINQLYTLIKSYNWSKIISKDETFSIRTRVNSSIFRNSNIVTLKIKDAIVDRIRLDTQSRPSVDKDSPTYQIFVNVRDNKIKVYLNTSGDPLYIRGYRTKVHRAAINPCMAAGLIQLSTWDRASAFYDPMCGSGTIPIEALMLGISMPPRYKRISYAFKKWATFDENLYKQQLDTINSKIEFSKKIDIYASDNTLKNLDLVKRSLGILDLDDRIDMEVADIKDFKTVSDSGVIITNPPHGHRMSREDALRALYRSIGDTLKTNCGNHDAYIFSMNNTLSKSIGLKTKRKHVLKNGKLDCRLLYFPIQEGKFH
jgi:putative N6-adenine-specific DNA methylase